jgi:SAM-dependent methyltransferase
MPATDPMSVQSIEEAFWIVLGRAASPTEIRDELRGAGRRALLLRLLSSPEFRDLRTGLHANRGPAEDAPAREQALVALGSSDRFVESAYECLLGRPADENGRRHYRAALSRGETRANLVRSLILSEEFDQYVRKLSADAVAVPRDVQLCELANPAKWDNPEWLEILRGLGLSVDKLSMHRKPYELSQLIFGARRLGALREDSQVLSVGAGHEIVLYWLANHVACVFATDMYGGDWQHVQGREGDPNVIRQPEEYAPFPYRQDHLVFMKMDGRRLAFRDGHFDIAYSLSSIEHFGGMTGATETIREMARVLKPGGILALATEFVLQGPGHEETFQPSEFAQLIDQPGLQLVEPVDDRVYRRYEHTAIDLYKNPYQAPHMVVRFNDTIFTTVMVFLRRTK